MPPELPEPDIRRVVRQRAVRERLTSPPEPEPERARLVKDGGASASPASARSVASPWPARRCCGDSGRREEEGNVPIPHERRVPLRCSIS